MTTIGWSQQTYELNCYKLIRIQFRWSSGSASPLTTSCWCPLSLPQLLPTVLCPVLLWSCSKCLRYTILLHRLDVVFLACLDLTKHDSLHKLLIRLVSFCTRWPTSENVAFLFYSVSDGYRLPPVRTRGVACPGGGLSGRRSVVLVGDRRGGSLSVNRVIRRLVSCCAIGRKMEHRLKLFHV